MSKSVKNSEKEKDERAILLKRGKEGLAAFIPFRNKVELHVQNEKKIRIIKLGEGKSTEISIDF